MSQSGLKEVNADKDGQIRCTLQAWDRKSKAVITKNEFSKFRQPSLSFSLEALEKGAKAQNNNNGKSLNQLFRYLAFRWNLPKDRITLRQCRQPFEMIRSYEDWSFDKVHSFNYPSQFRIQDLLQDGEKHIQLLYQIAPCNIRELDREHRCSYRTKCRPQHHFTKNDMFESSSNLDDDLSSSNYLVSSDEEDEEEEENKQPNISETGAGNAR